MLSDFCVYLADQKAAELREQQQWRPRINSTRIGRGSYKLQWIETLLQTPINDHRKYCIWRILAPYLANVRKLTKEQASGIMKNWLDNCDQKIKEGLKGARKGYRNIGLDKLRIERPLLYNIIKCS